MNRPVRTTARAAPGDASVAVGAPPPESTAWPRKKEMKLRTSQNTTVSPAVTTVLVARRRGRLGAAAKVARMVPLEYSLVINRAPKTPPVRATVIMPVSDACVASKPR